jgi:hypothetical protein
MMPENRREIFIHSLPVESGRPLYQLPLDFFAASARF